MKEKIFTITVNEAFDAKDGCPICRMREQLERDEIERITGAAMMEPDIRIETNRLGFCARHLGQMTEQKAVLSVALTLESHLDELITRLDNPKKALFKRPKDPNEPLREQLHAENNSCYVCNRIADYEEKILDVLFWMYQKDENFKVKLAAQPYYCLPDLELLLSLAPKKLSAKDAAAFAETIVTLEKKALTDLKEDVSWFTKKFDHRYRDADWKNSKDAVPRAAALLTGLPVKKEG